VVGGGIQRNNKQTPPEIRTKPSRNCQISFRQRSKLNSLVVLLKSLEGVIAKTEGGLLLFKCLRVFYLSLKIVANFRLTLTKNIKNNLETLFELKNEF
jgi:hypothetical protein